MAHPSRKTPRIARKLARIILVLATAAGALFLMPTSAGAQGEEGCTDYEWHNDWVACVDVLPTGTELDCEVEPQPSTPDSGMAGWFAEPSELDKSTGVGTYSRYGYAGYQLPMYGSQEMSISGSCVNSISLPNGADTANALANMEFNVSKSVIGASNSLRQAAWEPDRMWGWSNGFMETVSQLVYEQVFTVFGAVTVGVIGIYLLWRSRQADMNNAVTTVAWAALILVLVTAVVRWPVQSANYTDEALKVGMNLSTTLIQDDSAADCIDGSDLTEDEVEEMLDRNRNNPNFCIDTRSASVLASDLVSNEVLYQNWLRTMLGQSEEFEYERENGEIVTEDGNPVVSSSNVAYKYGRALYSAQAFSWIDNEAASDPEIRDRLIEEKQELWRNLVAQIQQEDPEAYAHLSGERAWERTGTGLLTLLTSLFFALFDITASVLIILGFMIVRFAIVALPIVGTIAILRPAGGPFKRLVNTVLGAVINVAVFSLAAVIYIFATGRILGTTLPVPMQVILIGLLGVAAWMLLRPFRRINNLVAGGGPADALLGRRRDTEKEREIERERERIVERTRDQTRPEGQADRGSVRTAERTETRSAPPDHQPGQQAPSTASTSGDGVYRPQRGS
ncbi:hypothetical protein [Glycomyces salinus]|uniref:hypothetical protein n=1 Tax=Glycomyces salinus TaxID=980294 RepID=UPI0018EDDD40|nr:hypothetical protein [Glycomyces salinus]